MAGVFLGSIGFPVIYTLWKHYWHVRRWSLHAKLTLITTVALFFAGAAAFLALEYNNPKTFGSMDAWDTTFQAFFLSAMTRSGGFSVVDIGELYGSSLIVGSHAHVRRRRLGVHGRRHQGDDARRARARRVVRGEGPPVGRVVRPPHPERRAARRALGRRVGRDDRARCRRSRSPRSARRTSRDVLFDVISAFGTVGLSTGLTAELTDPAVYVMAVTIFMGRIGTVTLAAAVAATSRSQLYSLPVERPIVG